MKVSELREALKVLKKTHKEIKITGLKKAELEALYNKYKTKRQKLEEDIKEIQSRKKPKAKKPKVKKEKVVKEVAKEPETKSVVHNTFTNAEQVFFNPDLLRMIGGYKKDLELSEKIEKIVNEVGFPEGSDDYNTIRGDTFVEALLDDLKIKKNPAVSEIIGFGSYYGGEGSQGGALLDIYDKIIERIDHSFEMKAEKIPYRYYEDIEQYFDYLMEYHSNTDEDDRTVDSEGDEIHPISKFDYGPHLYKLKISYTTEEQRKEAIHFLEVCEAVIQDYKDKN